MALASVPKHMSEAEWSARVDLAAAYQLTDLYGWTDMAGTHISARIPGTDEFLLNPFGLFFEEITASSLIKVDCDGNLFSDSEYPINPAGFIIHSAVHMGNPTAHCVMHTHTRAGNAVAMQSEGLLPITQKALILEPFLSYHDYEGIALNEDEKPRLVADLGDCKFLILRNHGLLTVGESIPEAVLYMYALETACQTQIAAQSGGNELVHVPDAIVQGIRAQVDLVLKGSGAELAWPGLLRKLDRLDPYFRD